MKGMLRAARTQPVPTKSCLALCYLLPSVKVYLPSCLSAVKLRLEPQTHELLEVKDSVGWDGIII